MIGITKKGQLYINKKMYDHAQLKEKLTLKFEVNPRLSVMIVADKDSAMKHTVSVMDICKKIGIEEFAIAEEVRK